MNPIFVKIRNDNGEIYQSYDIIWKLIDWNFSSCELNEVNPNSDNVYIFIPENGNVKACCSQNHIAKYILWNIEIPQQDIITCPDWFDEMWLSCRYFYSLVPNKKRFVVLGGDKRLFFPADKNKKWDFCHLAYLYGRRAAMVEKMMQEGFTMSPIGFGEERDKAIAQSRWGLCLHQNPVPALSPQRMTLFANRKLPIIIEDNTDTFPYWTIPLSRFDKNKDYSDIAEQNYKLIVEEYNFKKRIEGAFDDFINGRVG